MKKNDKGRTVTLRYQIWRLIERFPSLFRSMDDWHYLTHNEQLMFLAYERVREREVSWPS